MSQNPISSRLSEIPDEFGAIVRVCERYTRHGGHIDSDGVALIANQPWVAPQAYAFRIYPPAKDAWFSRYHENTGVEIPNSYRTFLSVTNGCFLFGISLCGMPPSMLEDTPLLDRSRLQCHDLGAANRSWKFGYAVDHSLFYFGGRDYSFSENSGYFLDTNHCITAFLSDGSAVCKWDSFEKFLEDEIAASEELESDEFPDKWKA